MGWNFNPGGPYRKLQYFEDTVAKAGNFGQVHHPMACFVQIAHDFWVNHLNQEDRDGYNILDDNMILDLDVLRWEMTILNKIQSDGIWSNCWCQGRPWTAANQKSLTGVMYEYAKTLSYYDPRVPLRFNFFHAKVQGICSLPDMECVAVQNLWVGRSFTAPANVNPTNEVIDFECIDALEEDELKESCKET